MDKEEIIDRNIGFVEHLSYCPREDVYRCMDEYAKQQAIGFAEWLGDNYETYDKGIYWSHSDQDNEAHTTEELYSLYLTQQK